MEKPDETLGFKITGCFCKAINLYRINESQGVSFGFMTACFGFPLHLTKYFLKTFYVLFRLPFLFSFLLESKAAFIARVYFCVISCPSNTTFTCKGKYCLNSSCSCWSDQKCSHFFIRIRLRLHKLSVPSQTRFIWVNVSAQCACPHLSCVHWRYTPWRQSYRDNNLLIETIKTDQVHHILKASFFLFSPLYFWARIWLTQLQISMFFVCLKLGETSPSQALLRLIPRLCDFSCSTCSVLTKHILYRMTSPLLLHHYQGVPWQAISLHLCWSKGKMN